MMKRWVAIDATGEVFASCASTAKTFEEFAKQYEGKDCLCKEMDWDHASQSMDRWSALQVDDTSGLVSCEFQNEMEQIVMVSVHRKGNRFDVCLKKDRSQGNIRFTKEEALKLTYLLGESLFPLGSERQETLVVRCAQSLPDWIRKAHMEKGGCFGIRIEALGLGNAMRDNEKQMEKIGEAWERYRDKRCDDARADLDDLLGYE